MDAVLWVAVGAVLGAGVVLIATTSTKERDAERWGKHLSEWEDEQTVVNVPYDQELEGARRISRDVILRRRPWSR